MCCSQVPRRQVKTTISYFARVTVKNTTCFGCKQVEQTLPRKICLHRIVAVHEYRLVRANPPSLCQPRMPHAIATRMSHIWYHTDHHEQWRRVTKPVFFLFWDLGLALAAKTCHHRPQQSLKKDNGNQAFPWEE